MDDAGLLSEYARTGAESAFAALVERHVGLVYSAAYRQLRDAQLAEDVTQAVFVVLARKAGELVRHPGLSGWLLKTTRYVANSHIRATQRRIRREQEAGMQLEWNESAPSIWRQLEPHLDEALASLGETDRAVLALRYFENKSAAEIGQVLSLSEAAAKKRALRALDKLRAFFNGKGITLSAAVIATAMAAHAVKAAPAGLAAKVTAGVFSYAFASLPSQTTLSKALARTLITSTAIILVVVGTVTWLHGSKQLSSPPTVLSQNSPLAATTVQSPPALPLATRVTVQQDKLPAAMNHLRWALHTRPGTHEDFNSSEITTAIDEFGLYRMQALNILQESAAEPEDFVVRGAIYGMGHLGKKLPQVAPALWDMLNYPAQPEHWTAFGALQSIGFSVWDLPALIGLLTNADDSEESRLVLNGAVPESIANLLDRNPEAVAQYAPALEPLLSDASFLVRSRSALALVGVQGLSHPAVLSPLHELLSLTNSWDNQYLQLLAAPLLGKAGSAAKPLVPDLLQLATNATEPSLRSAVRDALVQIEPDLAGTEPHLAAALQKRNDARDWASLWKSKSFTLEDLRAALHDPQQAYTAAGLLANLGTNARPAVPEMLRAIWGRDEDTRNEMLAYIHKIEPNVVVHPIYLANVILPGNVAAYAVLEQQQPSDANTLLQQTIMKVDGEYGWMLPEEWAAYTNQMATLNWDAYLAFAKAMNPSNQLTPTPIRAPSLAGPGK